VCLSVRIVYRSLPRSLAAISLSHYSYGMQVWDKDSFSADDRIGVARCSLREIQSGVEVPLMSEDGSKGAPNGTLIFESCRVELKYYKFGGLANPALLRFYAEHVWNLPKPEVDSVCLAFLFECLSISLAVWPSLHVGVCVHRMHLCACRYANARVSMQMPLRVGRYGLHEMLDVI